MMMMIEENEDIIIRRTVVGLIENYRFEVNVSESETADVMSDVCMKYGYHPDNAAAMVSAAVKLYRKADRSYEKNRKDVVNQIKYYVSKGML